MPERVSNYDNLVAKPHSFSDGNSINGMSEADLTAIIQRGGRALGKSAVADPPYRTQEIAYTER